MAPSLSSLAANALAGSQTGRQAGVDRTGQVFQKAGQRIVQQRELTAVQLSSFGRIKSAFADTRTAAAALSGATQAAGGTELRKLADNFVEAFNNAVQTTRAVATQPGIPAVESSRAGAAEADLRRSLGSEAALADLRKIGVVRQPDGSLSVDSKAFDAALNSDPGALRSALSRVGQEVDRAATGQLTEAGAIGKTLNALTERAKSLETRQAEQQTLAAAAQQAVSAQANRFNSLDNGATAYQRIFSA